MIFTSSAEKAANNLKELGINPSQAKITIKTE
jgi:hypothetical protein